MSVIPKPTVLGVGSDGRDGCDGLCPQLWLPLPFYQLLSSLWPPVQGGRWLLSPRQVCDAEAQTRGHKGTGGSCRRAGSWPGPWRGWTHTPPQNAVATPASLPFPLHLVPEASVLSLSGLLGWWHGHRGLSRSPMAVRGGPPVPGDCDPRPGSCLLSLIGWFPPRL